MYSHPDHHQHLSCLTCVVWGVRRLVSPQQPGIMVLCCCMTPEGEERVRSIMRGPPHLSHSTCTHLPDSRSANLSIWLSTFSLSHYHVPPWTVEPGFDNPRSDSA